MPPRRVRRIGAWLPQSTQPWKVPIRDTRAGKRHRERLDGEMRMTPRPGNGANVAESPDAMCPKEPDKLVERARRMTDRVNDRRLAIEGTGVLGSQRTPVPSLRHHRRTRANLRLLGRERALARRQRRSQAEPRARAVLRPSSAQRPRPA